MSIRVHINGEPREVPAGTTVVSLLALLDITTPRVAVEINAHVITRALHEQTTLTPGDHVEIVTFVGGG